MAKINLLPWREELRKQKKQDFGYGILFSVLVTVGILVLVHMHIEGLMEYQSRRNKMLQDEIAVFDKKIAEIKDIEGKKDRLLKKIEVIQRLQESRPQIVHLFDEIARVTPDGVFLTKLNQSGANLTLTGKAESNARVSAYMRAIESSPWLTMPKLDVIQGPGSSKSGNLNNFKLYAKQGTPQKKAANSGR
ncbi:MAG: PilN domain-containing protein [Gammaproteobacteria bacterium]